MAKLETLTDDFSEGSIDTAKWTDIGGNCSITDGALDVPIFGEIEAASTYSDLTDSHFAFKVAALPTTGDNWLLEIIDSSSNAIVVSMMWMADDNAYQFASIGSHGGGSFTEVPSLPLWVRVRHDSSANQIYLEYSNDGSSWTSFSSGSDTSFATSAVDTYFTYSSGPGTGTPLVIDDVNVTPSTPSTAKLDHVRITVYYTASGATFAQTCTEAVVLASSLTRTATKRLIEAVALAPSFIRTTSRTLPETVATAATLARSTGRTFTEKIGLSAAVTSFISKAKTLTETIATSDTLVRLLRASRRFVEAVGVSDAVSAARVLPAAFHEALAVSASLTKKAGKVLIEIVVPVASFTRRAARVLAESVAAADTVTATKSFRKTLAERIAAADSFVRSLGRTLSETVQLGASLTASKVFNRSFSESVAAADTLDRSIGKRLVEAVGLSDAFSRVWTIVRTLTEHVGMADTLRKLLNGFDVFWKNASKHAATLANQVKTAVSLSNIAKAVTDWRNQKRS